jgi:hypothetical protein
MMLYTFKEDNAKIYNKPKFISARKHDILKGMTIQPAKPKTNVRIGAPRKISLLALRGIIISFNTAFNPSANGCNNPQIPTTFGPRLLCIAAIIFRSASV